MYSLKEIFYTIQGEGMYTGKPAVFLRFTGCNLWTGHERHRISAICKFCDTDFVGTDGENGGKYEADELVNVIFSLWPSNTYTKPFLVLTGGEPAMQIDQELIDLFHENGFVVSIETNGTLPLPKNIDWVCVSPKSNAELALLEGDELKLVYPQQDALPERFSHLKFNRFSLQPMDGPHLKENIIEVLDYCKANPQWEVSLQTHKILGIP